VRSATGATYERYADAVAMNLYPSRGMGVLGFEIKVRRGDWLRELHTPDKSAPIQRYCDRWWIVAGDKAIVKKEEVPSTWGLMVASSNRLLIVKEAPKLEAQPLDRAFVASILRRAYESLTAAKADDDLFKRGKEEGTREGIEKGRQSAHFAMRDLENLRKSVKDFEKSSGLSITQYNGGRLGDAVESVQRMLGNRVDVGRTLQNAKRPLELALNTLSALEKLSELEEADVLGSSAP